MLSSVRRPSAVILTRATSIARLPATTRSAVAVASPARTSLTIYSIVKPCAIMIASVRRSLHDASSSSARRRVAGGKRLVALRRGFPTADIVSCAYVMGDAQASSAAVATSREGQHSPRSDPAGQRVA
jgi:hypothetical protein